ncbi:hypothetical protein GF312_07200 [Candidatus Poribacteria bacterium]|nr:hypothetical protein [Candidatus Poribacteria bacterium]
MKRPLYKTLLSVFLILIYYNIASAENNICLIDRGETALKQSLLDMANDITIMCLAAHPDDEDGATLTYYRRKYGVQTAILYSTRGEGGQNEIGPELYEELGVIRAREIQQAASIYGAEVYDLNKRDFGYSKDSEEAFSFWGREDTLRRMVRVIRQVRPHVIITNHDTEYGHGHHQASGILILEAFHAAADEKSFPEQLESGLSTWQVKRLFVRSSKEDADVTINVGEYDPIRGLSYAQIANEGLKMHKSQGMGRKVKPGPVYRHYILVKTSMPKPDKLHSLLDGLEKHKDIPQPDFVDKIVNSIYFSRNDVTEKLLDYLKKSRKLDSNDPIIQEKQRETELAIARSLNLILTAKPDDNMLVPGQEFEVNLSLTNCGHEIIRDIEFTLEAPESWEIHTTDGTPVSDKLGYNETVKYSIGVKVSDNAEPTLPHAEHLYDDSFMKSIVKGKVNYRLDDVQLSLKSEVNFNITPGIQVSVLPEAKIVPISDKPQALRYVIDIANRTRRSINGKVEMIIPDGWGIKAVQDSFDLAQDEHAFAAFDINIPGETKSGKYTIEAVIPYKALNGKWEMAIGEGIINLVDVKVAPDIYVGYVKSYDNTIEWSLKHLGVKSRSLDSDDLRFGDLSVYDTIILDIRAYLVRQDLRESNRRLMDYVKNGGNLLVMYHKTFEWNGNNYAPYKIILSRNRITVEEASIKLLKPEHPLLSYPNRITDSDWDGWIQERGLYFPSEWSSKYTELLSSSDPGEEPLTGGYLVAEYGKGTYIYTSYVWYRQLQILNPGAFRNFANMISMGQ